MAYQTYIAIDLEGQQTNLNIYASDWIDPTAGQLFTPLTEDPEIHGIIYRITLNPGETMLNHIPYVDFLLFMGCIPETITLMVDDQELDCGLPIPVMCLGNVGVLALCTRTQTIPAITLNRTYLQMLSTKSIINILPLEKADEQ